MKGRERIILMAVWVFSLGAAATPARAQTPTEQKVAEFVEALRGRKSEASFEDGHYRHAGIAFDVPAEWHYGGTLPGEEPADDTAHWTDPQSGVGFYAWLSRRKVAPENVATLLADVVASKTRQRELQGFRRWHVRAESVQHTSIVGREAVVAVADFETRFGGPRIERLTWIYTSESRILFFATMSPDQLATFEPEFARVVQSTTVP